MGRFFVEELSGAYQSCLLTPCVSSCKKVSFFVFSILSKSNLFCGSNCRKLPNNVANVPIFGRKYCCGRCFNDTFIGIKLLYLLLHFVAFFHVASQGQTMKKLQSWTTEYFFMFQLDFNVEISPKNATKHPVAQWHDQAHSGLNSIFCCQKNKLVLNMLLCFLEQFQRFS